MDRVHEKKRILVFDAPTRIFHWVFAFAFIGAFLIGKTSDDDAAIFPLHAAFGMIMLLALILRAVWGIFGTKFAKFSSFNLNPVALFQYLGSVFNNEKSLNIGRNPASSFAAFTMFALAIGLGFTGYNMAIGKGGHDLKEVHEVLATLFLLTAIAHVFGIIIHTIKQKDSIGLAMIDGRKSADISQDGITNSKMPIALGFVLALGLGGFAIAKNYDPYDRAFNLMGQKLVIGENEENEKENGETKEDEKSEKDEKSEQNEDEKLEAGAQINNFIGIKPVEKPINNFKEESKENEKEDEAHEKRESEKHEKKF